MKISEVIKVLEQFKKEFGDLPFYSAFDNGCCEFEITDKHIILNEMEDGFPNRISCGEIN